MQYQIFKKEQAMDTLRNTTTHPIDHVAKFSYKVEVDRLVTLFDGTEKGLSWDWFPWVYESDPYLALNKSATVGGWFVVI